MEGDKDVTNLVEMKRFSMPKDVSTIMDRYQLVMERFINTLFHVTMRDKTEDMTNFLDWVEQANSWIRRLFYDEQTEAIGYYDAVIDRFEFDNLPIDLCLVPDRLGFTIKNLPKWMLGHGARIKYPLLFREEQPFIRKLQLWYRLIDKLKLDYLRSLNGEESLIPDVPPVFSRAIVIFRSANKRDIRDLDHYLPPFEAVVNSLRGNNLIRSDGPGYFSYAIDWEKDESAKEPVIDLRVYTSKSPFEQWINITNNEYYKNQVNELEEKLDRAIDEITKLKEKQYSWGESSETSSENISARVMRVDLKRNHK